MSDLGLALPLHDKRARRRIGGEIVSAAATRKGYPLSAHERERLRRGLLAGSIDGFMAGTAYVLAVSSPLGREVIMHTHSWKRYLAAVNLALQLRSRDKR